MLVYYNVLCFVHIMSLSDCNNTHLLVRSDVRSEAARKGTETSHEGDKQVRMCEITISCVVHAVFSLAYLRHVGPINLQYRVSFSVGIGIIHVLCCGHRLHPNYPLPSCLEFSLRRTLTCTSLIPKALWGSVVFFFQ